MTKTTDRLKSDLHDFQSWASVNSDFSLIDYIHHALNSVEKATPDFAFAMLELLWPTFHEVDNQVFLKEEFTEKRYQELRRINKGSVEKAINCICIDSVFTKLSFESQNYIASKIVEMWKAKLLMDFPNRSFVVARVVDDEEIDCVFYSIKSE